MAGGLITGPAISASVGIAARTWPAAMGAAGRGLVRLGAAEPRYVQRCITLVEEQGPYIVVAPGIALAHARPEDGALTLGLSVAVLAEPVVFGHPANDPVDVVFAFCSPDRDAHVGLLSALARHLASGLADRLRAAATGEAATQILEEVLDHG